MKQFLQFALVMLTFGIFSGCQNTSSNSMENWNPSSAGPDYHTIPGLGSPIANTPPNPTNSGNTPDPSISPRTPRTFSVDALVYQGDSTAFGDAEAIVSILEAHGKSYRVLNSAEFDQLTLDDLADYGLILWPGGYAGYMSSSMTRATRDRIRAAVTERGVGFVGFCAGAFIAISPDTSWGFALLAQETLPYYHLEDDGIDSSMVDVEFADGSHHDLLWWGGPRLPEIPNGVIARYSDDRTPAIAQAWIGKGLMVLAGPHPESPADWRTKLGLSDSDGLDQAIAWQMINAALTQTPMAVMN